MRSVEQWVGVVELVRVRVGMAAAVSACALAGFGCSESPTAPGAVQARTDAVLAGATEAGGGQDVAAASANLTPEDFAAHGWECRPSPVPGRVACSRPNQGFPAVPPPDDRPPSYTLLIWDNGTFTGTVILIRPDLYSGQPCDSTSAPYVFRPVIGYYECLHTIGG